MTDLMSPTSRVRRRRSAERRGRRPGYSIDFLGPTIDLASIPAVGDEIAYLHVGDVVNLGRRSPVRYDSWLPAPRLSGAIHPTNDQLRGTGFDPGRHVALGHVAWGSEHRSMIATRSTHRPDRSCPTVLDRAEH